MKVLFVLIVMINHGEIQTVNNKVYHSKFECMVDNAQYKDSDNINYFCIPLEKMLHNNEYPNIIII